MNSNDPMEVLRAARAWKDVEQRERIDSKSITIDPLEQANALGYKNKTTNITYGALRMMSRTPIVRAIINTRIEQVAAFSQPQPDKYSPGFIIQKKKYLNKNSKITKEEERKIGEITEYVLNCGMSNNKWHGDDFNKFLRKTTQDSLTFDQMTYEPVRNRKGQVAEFFATDGSTYRIAASIDEENYRGRDKVAIQGYLPSYVQIIDEVIRAEFYPWELCFGIRNPTTSIYNNGYGQSELEDLVMTVTSMLYADQYNSSFFRNGSAPKGIIKIKGNISPDKLQSFRQQWRAMVAGVGNANKTPVMNADEMEWIDLSKNNRDMEFKEFQEYLLKTCCAIYKIDPEEIGFGKQSGGSSKPLFESSGKARLEYSRDKGLKPLLTFHEAHFNKYVMNPTFPEFELKFVGLDSNTPQEELESDIKKLSNFMTLDEIRTKYDLKNIGEGGDMILNNIFYQNIAAKRAQEQERNMNPENSNKDNSPFNFD